MRDRHDSQFKLALDLVRQGRGRAINKPGRRTREYSRWEHESGPEDRHRVADNLGEGQTGAKERCDVGVILPVRSIQERLAFVPARPNKDATTIPFSSMIDGSATDWSVIPPKNARFTRLSVLTASVWVVVVGRPHVA